MFYISLRIYRFALYRVDKKLTVDTVVMFKNVKYFLKYQIDHLEKL